MSVCQAINLPLLRSYHDSLYLQSHPYLYFELLAAGRPLCDHRDMRSRIQPVALPSEIGDFADEVRLVFLELGRVFGGESLAGECSPAVDVYETDDTMEITVDLPGVVPGALRLFGKGDNILIAGEKSARRARGESSFHLVERGYGHFARVVRLSHARETPRRRAAHLDSQDRRPASNRHPHHDHNHREWLKADGIWRWPVRRWSIGPMPSAISSHQP